MPTTDLPSIPNHVDYADAGWVEKNWQNWASTSQNMTLVLFFPPLPWWSMGIGIIADMTMPHDRPSGLLGGIPSILLRQAC
jgi:hypothetical protein